MTLDHVGISNPYFLPIHNFPFAGKEQTADGTTIDFRIIYYRDLE